MVLILKTARGLSTGSSSQAENIHHDYSDHLHYNSRHTYLTGSRASHQKIWRS